MEPPSPCDRPPQFAFVDPPVHTPSTTLIFEHTLIHVDFDFYFLQTLRTALTGTIETQISPFRVWKRLVRLSLGRWERTEYRALSSGNSYSSLLLVRTTSCSYRREKQFDYSSLASGGRLGSKFSRPRWLDSSTLGRQMWGCGEY